MPDRDYHNTLDADEAANPQLLEPKHGLKAGLIGFFLIVGSVTLLGMPFLLNHATPVADTEVVPDGQFMPSYSGQLNLTPPPPKREVAAQSQLPAETRAQGSDDENAQRRRAAEETARKQAEAEEAANHSRQQDRYRSPMIVSELSPVDTVVAQAAKKPEEPAKSPGTFQAANPNDQFLASKAGGVVEIAKANKNQRIDALVPQGTILRGVLETAVQTDLPGMVRAVTTEDVWSFDGRRILIPAGSRLIGEYDAGVVEGQTRAFIVWTRLLRADGVSLSLGSIGTDELGRSGMGGDVNNHYFRRYGPAVLLSTISAAGQILAAANDTSNITAGPITTTITNPATGVSTSSTTYPNNNTGANMTAKGAAIVAQSFSQVMGEAMKSSLAIKPTITINQGAAVAISVGRDLDFSDLYSDPVRERLKALKQVRYSHEE